MQKKFKKAVETGRFQIVAVSTDYMKKDVFHGKNCGFDLQRSIRGL